MPLCPSCWDRSLARSSPAPFCNTPLGAGSSWSTCRSVYWQSSWRFCFCPMIAKRPGQENSILLASPCSLLDLCSSCMVGSSSRAYRSYGSPGFHRSACGFLQDGHSKRGQGAHRSSAIQEKDLLCGRHRAVHVERNLVRGPNADSDLSHPRLWSIAERDRLAAGSAWSGDDLFLSMDGSPDTAVWYTKGICRRRASGLRRHAAISLPSPSRTRLRRARRCSIPARSGPERSWHSLHLGCIRCRQKTGPADGNNLTQHRAAPRRPDSDHALRDLPGVEVGDGTVRRQPLQRIYRCLSSTLRITRFPVCYRPEITSFPGQGDRTTSCRTIACLIGDDVRVN